MESREARIARVERAFCKGEKTVVKGLIWWDGGVKDGVLREASGGIVTCRGEARIVEGEVQIRVDVLKLHKDHPPLRAWVKLEDLRPWDGFEWKGKTVEVRRGEILKPLQQEHYTSKEGVCKPSWLFELEEAGVVLDEETWKKWRDYIHGKNWRYRFPLTVRIIVQSETGRLDYENELKFAVAVNPHGQVCQGTQDTAEETRYRKGLVELLSVELGDEEDFKRVQYLVSEECEDDRLDGYVPPLYTCRVMEGRIEVGGEA